MSPTTSPPKSRGNIPELQNGDRLSRDEFERRYHAMPELKKAELIEGVVHMPSPVKIENHAEPHFHFNYWLGHYKVFTPGVRGGDNGTIRLDLDNEPQPDSFLFIDPMCGGQAHIDEEDYVAGAPELAGEIAASSVSYDLHTKLTIYRRNRVLEYIIWRVLDGEIDWFILRGSQYEKLTPDPAGIVRSVVFPGLWLDVPAMIQGEMTKVFAVAQQGLASPEHADFVKQLQSRRAK